MDRIENYSYQDLRLIASQLNIPHRSRMNKVELYQEILNTTNDHMLRENAFIGGKPVSSGSPSAKVTNFFKKIVGKCKMPPPPVHIPSINFQQNTPVETNRQVLNYCTNAIRDLQTLKPTADQEIAIHQFNDFVRVQNSQIQKQLVPKNNTPRSRNSLISDIATLGNSCKNFYTPLRQQITKDKCY